jgi:uncharacterized protein YjbI with pentapeptide repeats
MSSCEYRFSDEKKCLCTTGLSVFKVGEGHKCVLHRPRDNSKDDILLFYEGIEEYISKYFNIFEVKFDEKFSDNFDPEMYADKEIKFCGIFFRSSTEKKIDNMFIAFASSLKRVDFYDCEINFENIKNYNACLFFENCDFPKDYDLGPLRENAENRLECVYKNCTFHGLVRSHGRIYTSEDLVINYPVFLDCRFKGDIQLCYTIFNRKIFSASHDRFHSRYGNIHINDCTIKDRFSINNIDVESLDVFNTSFLDKFEMKYKVYINKNESPTVIDHVDFDNVQFSSVADFHGMNVNRLSMSRVDFKQFAIFENIRVHCKDKANFSYVTFHSTASFRKADFNGGLDLDCANFLGEISFLGISDNNNSTRETYRLIKNHFDDKGNHIEGNKFFALEMDKYLEEITLSNSLSAWDRFVFNFNKITSNFGQSYIRGVSWLLSIATIFYALTLSHEAGLLYKIWPAANPIIACVSKFLNGFAETFMPFKSFLREGMEFLSLIFYIIFAVLIWQIVVALKRHTRR